MVVKVPEKLTVSVSPTTAVVIFVPPAIVNVSVAEFAVVLPESPVTVWNKLTELTPALSSAGTQLVPFHFRVWFKFGATVVTSTFARASIPEYSVKSFALVSPTPPAVILMFTYGLSSPSTVKKYPPYDAAAGAAAREAYSFLYFTVVGKLTEPSVPEKVLVMEP